jgi:predicted Fe-Mo cluster-binding NifX family protein
MHDHAHHHDPRRAATKFAAIQGSDVLIVRGIGSPAVGHAEQLGMRVYVVAEQTVAEALAAYREGQLTHDPRRIHRH